MLRFCFVLMILNSAPAICQEAEFSFKKKNLRHSGKVEEGEKVTFTYAFTNQGDAPLILESYKVSCPCTSVTLPDPVPPGEQGVISVVFDTADKIGYQDRRITLISNAKDGPHEIRFRIMVNNP